MATVEIKLSLTPEKADALADEIWAFRKYAATDAVGTDLWTAQEELGCSLVSAFPGRWPSLEYDLNGGT